MTPKTVARLVAAVAAALVVSVPCAAGSRAARTPAQDPTLRDIEAALLDATQRLSDDRLADGETLPDPQPDPLLDRLGGDLPCGTVLARAAARVAPSLPHERRVELLRLLAAPQLAARQQWTLPGENIVLHFDTSVGSRHAISRRDVDGNRVPDAIDEVAASLSAASARIADLLGPHAFTGPDGNLHVHLAAVPFAEGRSVSGVSPAFVLPRGMQGAEGMQAAAHQLAHAILHDTAPDLSESLEEAVATFLAATILTPEGWPDPATLLPERPAARAVLSPGVTAARGDAAFLAWLSRRDELPPTWLGEALAAVGQRLDAAREQSRVLRAQANQAAADGFDETLREHGLTLADAVAGYHAWALEEEMSRRGSAGPLVYATLRPPADESAPASALPPFGQLRYEIVTPAVGGLRLALDGDERTRASVVALLDDGTVRRHDLDPDRGAGWDLSLPGGPLARVVVLVTAPEPPADWKPWEGEASLVEDAASGYVVRAGLDPAYPAVLSGIGAEVRPGQVTLEWSTASEEDLAGWLVERAVRSTGPYSPVSRVPLPAQSRPGHAASYAFVDPTVRPGARYLYRVVAVTPAGLVERFSPVSIRALPSAMSPVAAP